MKPEDAIEVEDRLRTELRRLERVEIPSYAVMRDRATRRSSMFPAGLAVTAALVILLSVVAGYALRGRDSDRSSAAASGAPSCQTATERSAGYIYGGALGVQEGISVRLRAGDPPLKILWANRAAVPPREMTITASKTDGDGATVTFRAGWAATTPTESFPAAGPVVGYVSEIPTLPTAGCWEFRWVGGGPADYLRVSARPAN